MARLGNALLVAGLLILAFGGLWLFGLVPGSRVSVPAPVALERATPGQREVGTLATRQPTPSPQQALPTLEPTQPRSRPTLDPTPPPPVVEATHVAPSAAPPTPVPTRIAIHLAPADAAERASAIRPPPGYAVRLAIPAINVDTVVKQAGIVADADGQPVWETLPFVAVHYGDLTSRIGAFGNAVIAGHVVTLREGNVFRALYQVNIDDQINVWDDNSREHDFHVVDIKLVPPSDTSVMMPTPDETLTLITCGGTFDPVRRLFSDRLVVTAKPVE